MTLTPEDYEALATDEATRAKAIIDGRPAQALVHATLAVAYAALAHTSATTTRGGDRTPAP